MAKALTEYAKKEPKLNVRVGLVEGQVLAPGQITALAELPPREVLLGRMLSSMQSPLAGLVGVLQGVLRQLVYVIQAVKDAKEQASQESQLADRQVGDPVHRGDYALEEPASQES